MTRLLYDPKAGHDDGGDADAQAEEPRLPPGVVLDDDGWPVGDDVIRDASVMRLAEHYANARQSHHGHHTILRYAGEWYACRRDRCGHEVIADELLAADVLRHLDGLLKPVVDRHGKPTGAVCGFCPTIRQRDGAIEALKSTVAQLRGDVPKWVGINPPDLPPRSTITFRNGVLNLDAWLAGSDTLVPPDPRWFCPAALPFDYDPNAGKPTVWLKFLDSLALKPDERDLLQMWMGYLLTPDTSQQKALMFVGPKRSGKGTIMRTMTHLVGVANTASPTLGSLGTNFGLQPLVGKRLATITDARLSGRTDQAVVTERLLSITGEDSQTIDRKHREPVTLKLDARFVVATNELPRLADSSGALSGRMLILPLRRSFYGNEDHGLSDRLAAELPSIVVWAMEGLAMLREQGRFEQPASGASMQQEMDDLGSPVAAFVREWCEVGAGNSVPCGELYGSWRRWCDAAGRGATNRQIFGRDLAAAVPGITTANRRDDFAASGRTRHYEGIGLMAEGKAAP